MRDIPGGHLAIGTIPTAVEVASVLVAQCRRQVPALTVDIQSLTTSDLLRRLQKQDLDIAITYQPGEDTGVIDTRSLYAERYVLIAHKDRTLPPTLSWHDAADLPLAVSRTRTPSSGSSALCCSNKTTSGLFSAAAI